MEISLDKIALCAVVWSQLSQ